MPPLVANATSVKHHSIHRGLRSIDAFFIGALKQLGVPLFCVVFAALFLYLMAAVNEDCFLRGIVRRLLGPLTAPAKVDEQRDLLLRPSGAAADADSMERSMD
jgi:hypothetical protein